jgi:hypothetical protein
MSEVGGRAAAGRKRTRPVFLAVSAGVLVVVAVLLYLAHRRGQLLAASLVLFVLAVAASGLAYAAVATDYRDADGFVDCWPSCTAIQEATGFGIFLAPAVAVCLRSPPFLARGPVVARS